MGLFTPIWMTEDSSKLGKAKDAILKISDVEKLSEIARTAPNKDIREFTMQHIDDENVLYNIFKEEKNDVMRSKVALSSFKNEDILFEIALNDSYSETRQHAAWKIKSEDLFKKLAFESDDDEVVVYAMKQIHDQTVFYNLYREGKSSHIRGYAVTFIDDQSQVYYVACNDEDDYIRQRAIETLTDLDLLADVVEKLSFMHYATCEDACKRMLFVSNAKSIGEDKHFATIIKFAPQFDTKVRASEKMQNREEARRLLHEAALKIPFYFSGKEIYIYGYDFYEMIKVDTDTLAHNVLTIFDREEMVEPFIEKIITGLQLGWTEEIPSIKLLEKNAVTDAQKSGIAKLKSARDAAYEIAVSHYMSTSQVGVSDEHLEKTLGNIRSRYYGDDE